RSPDWLGAPGISVMWFIFAAQWSHDPLGYVPGEGGRVRCRRSRCSSQPIVFTTALPISSGTDPLVLSSAATTMTDGTVSLRNSAVVHTAADAVLRNDTPMTLADLV